MSRNPTCRGHVLVTLPPAYNVRYRRRLLPLVHSSQINLQLFMFSLFCSDFPFVHMNRVKPLSICLIVLLSVLTHVLGNSTTFSPQARIINGQIASRGRYPYTVQLWQTGSRQGFHCGGTLIGKLILLNVSTNTIRTWLANLNHCLSEKPGPDCSSLQLGKSRETESCRESVLWTSF